jgi:glutamine synthetase
MSTLRFKALETLPFKDFRKDNSVEIPAKLSELFCQNVFSEETMREYLTKEAFSLLWMPLKKEQKSRDILQIR